jgi:hypothetical protein
LFAKKTFSTMEKRNTLGLLLAGALAGGALYFLLFTERGRKLLDRLTEMASEKLDEWLAELEKELAEAENEVEEEPSVGHS